MGNMCQRGTLTADQQLKLKSVLNIETFSHDTGFDNGQIELLYSQFLKMDKNGDGFLEFADLRKWSDRKNPLQEKVLLAFLGNRQGLDQAQVKEKIKIDFAGYLTRMAVFRKADGQGVISTIENKTNFLFDVYDELGQGFLTRASFRHPVEDVVLKNTMRDDSKRLVIETIMQEIGADKDGNIARKQFVDVCSKDDIASKMSINFASAF
ncbi:Calcineurin B homologous protein 1 [Halotydeus destructor]|nr:Calcineurin B homologous protein 1 [Halotydeus destructor]